MQGATTHKTTESICDLPLTSRPEVGRGDRPRVVVAMSSGVDSSTSAALLVEQGYDVIGVMMRIWGEATSGGINRCCAPQAVADARDVARHLGIPFYLLDFQDEFKRYVVDYFVAEYAAGRTPSPCIMCNRHIRFRFLLQRALALEADYLATGHYARIRQTADGRYQLLKGADTQKDQSYFLYMLGQAQLKHVLFPVGGYTKTQVRQMARERGLPVAEKAESQELCFLADGDYRRFIQDYAPEAVVPGPILDQTGRVLGEHAGLPLYTIGQRRGLGIALGEPAYVLHMDRERNALVVGPDQALHQRELTVHSVSYVAGEPPAGEMAVTAKVRSMGTETPAILIPLDGDRAQVVFDRPVRAIAPGQAAVFYDDDVVIGGGIIE
ncbi:MAG: tRNA 2-thiouridine(34) synthase MnmA [Chloroflexi bacterium]|nr:MAG: tRNA 2-thiouridine(34) synthase MnmA [Chloroflexota bacterium]